MTHPLPSLPARPGAYVMLDYASHDGRRGRSVAVNHHLETVLGWLLLAVGGIGYLVAIVATVLRVNRQYSRVLPGSGVIRGGAAVWAATRFWYLLLVAIAGVVILLSLR